ncbi:hypothetical protein QE417_004414 [Mucilaginibacter terrae]|uniref:Uncharacterized protein n=1 Tax=Mucilaginibacter terrae TaxID=1955052 RepID=A0ABU3H003_9SPHI|nr:hypothetical protein [Mucilaginibacter terrae]
MLINKHSSLILIYSIQGLKNAQNSAINEQRFKSCRLPITASSKMNINGDTTAAFLIFTIVTSNSRKVNICLCLYGNISLSISDPYLIFICIYHAYHPN